MNGRNISLRHLATLLYFTILTQVFAIEVQDVKITRGDDGRETQREYVLATNGKVDDRFRFVASQEHSLGAGFRWDLDLTPTNTFDWAKEVPFKEYLEALYCCVDRFAADVPGGQVKAVRIYITLDSKTWQDVRKNLVPLVKDRVGFAVEFPKGSTIVADATIRKSPEIEQIGLQLAKRLKRRYTSSWLVWEGLVLERRTHEDYMRTWQDIVKLPDLSLNMYSLKSELEFEPLGKSRKK